MLGLVIYRFSVNNVGISLSKYVNTDVIARNRNRGTGGSRGGGEDNIYVYKRNHFKR